MTRVLIVEDQRMAQENMESIIRSTDTYRLAGTLSNAADAELFCMSSGVDLILMDVCTAHDENGIEAAAIIKKKISLHKSHHRHLYGRAFLYRKSKGSRCRQLLV